MRVPATGGSPQKLNDLNMHWPSISPDGRQIAAFYFADPTAAPKLAVMPAEGGAPTQLIDMPKDLDFRFPQRVCLDAGRPQHDLPGRAKGGDQPLDTAARSSPGKACSAAAVDPFLRERRDALRNFSRRQTNRVGTQGFHPGHRADHPPAVKGKLTPD